VALGDLPDNKQVNPFGAATLQADPEQITPDNLNAPLDIISQQASINKMPGTPLGAPKRNAYTVSTFDSRPPGGYDLTHDAICTLTEFI